MFLIPYKLGPFNRQRVQALGEQRLRRIIHKTVFGDARACAQSRTTDAYPQVRALGAAVAAGVGLYALWFVAKPVLGFVGDVGKARRAWKNPPIVV